MSSLHFVEFIVFAITLFLSLMIGVYFSCSGGRQKTVDEFLVGDRRISFLPVALSLLVTFQSGISLLGLPVEIYYYGTQISVGVVGLVLGYTFVAVFIVPVFHPLHITSAYEYLEMRFHSKGVRLIGSILGLLFNVTYMAVALFIPSIALEAVTGFSVNITVPLIAVVTIIYTMLGGLKAVVWTDVFQFLVMISGILAVLIKGISEAGGIETVITTCKKEGRLEFLNLDPDPTTRQTFWAVTLGTITSWIGNGLSQSGIQRICSTSSVKEGRKAVLANLPAAVLLECLMAFMGLVIFAYYKTKGCDPSNAGYIQSSNQIVPYFVMENISSIPGFIGLFMACLFSATLSTLSSGLSAVSALIWEDIVEPHCTNCKFHGTSFTRIIVCLTGAVVIGLAFLAMNLKGTITQITIGTLSATSGPLVGVFLLGMAFPWANAKSALFGGLLSLCLCCTMSVGAFLNPTEYEALPPVPTDGCFNSNNSSLLLTPLPTQNITGIMESTSNISSVSTVNSSIWLFRVSFLWYHLVGVLTTLILGVIITIVTGGLRDIPSEPQFLFKFWRKSNIYKQSYAIERTRKRYYELQRR